MAPLSTAYVRLRPVLSEAEVRSASARAGAVGGAAMGREFSTGFHRLTRAVVGLGIGTLAAEGGRAVLGLADKFELSRSRLESITKNIGGNVQNVDKRVSVLDQSMAKLGFTNADVEGSVASLETATKSVSKAIGDQSLAANIARGRGLDLATATQILMRVETGHVAMLSRLGIATKDSTGHLLTQQGALDALTRTYGGSATHFLTTYAGRQAALRAQLQNQASDIGNDLLPAFNDLAGVVQSDVIPPIRSATHFFDDNRKTIEPLVGTVLKLVLAYKAVKLAQRGLTALRGASLAESAVSGVGGGALGAAFSVARPLPVFVVNGVPGAGVGLVKTAEKGAVAGEEVAAGGLAARGASLLKSPLAAAIGLNLLGSYLSSSGHKTSGSGASFAGFGSLLGPEGTAAGALLGLVASAPSQGPIHRVGNVNHTASGGIALMGRFSGMAPFKDIKPAGEDSAALRDNAKASDKAASGQKNLAMQTNTSAEKFKNQAKALRDAQTRTLAIAGAQDQLRSAIANLAQTASSNGRALRGNSDAALANRDALRGAVQQAEAYVKTLRDQGVGHRKVAAAAEAMSRAIETNATKVYGDKGAIDVLLKSLHFLPGQIARGLAGIGSIGEQIGAQLDYSIAAGIGAYANVAVGQAGVVAAQIGKAARFGAQEPGGGQSSGNLVTPISPTAPQVKAAASYGAKVGKAVSDGYSPVVDKGVSQATNQAFQHAQSIMQTDLGNIKSFLSSQKQTIFSAFSSLDTSPRTDSLGASGPAKSILGQLNADKRLADQFTRLYIRLDDSGASARVLDMFEGLGPAAIPTMRLWLSHPRKLRQANRDLRRVGADAARVGERATEDKYGPLIHRDLEKLPHKLEQSLVAALRHLNITIDVAGHAKRRARAVRAS